jgi:hypothetical protein
VSSIRNACLVPLQPRLLRVDSLGRPPARLIAEQDAAGHQPRAENHAADDSPSNHFSITE